MKNIKNISKVFSCVFVITYLMFAYIANNFNCSDWDIAMRCIHIIICVFALIIFYSMFVSEK